MRLWIPGVVLLGLIGFGILGAFWSGSDVRPGGHEVVTRSVAADGTETIIIHEGGHRGFPFGFLIFPLGIFFLVFLVRGCAYRGAWVGNGPWRPDPASAPEPPGWFDDWHRRAHLDRPDTPAASADSPSSEPVQ